MSSVNLHKINRDTVVIPSEANKIMLFFDLDGILKSKDSSGNVRNVGYSDITLNDITEANSKLTQEYGGNFGLTQDDKQLDFNTKVFSILDAMIDNLPHPVYVQPTLTLAPLPAPEVREVGTPFVTSINASYVKNDGGDIIISRLTRNGSEISSSLTYSENIPQLSQGDTIYSAFVTYDDGAIKNNSAGIPDATGRILSSSINSYDRLIHATYPVFFGTLNPEQTIDDILLSSMTKLIIKSNGSISVNYPNSVGKKLVVIIPSDSTVKTIWWATPLNSGGIGGSGDLFYSPVLKTYNSPTSLWTGKQFRVYISSVTTFVGNMEFRNS